MVKLISTPHGDSEKTEIKTCKKKQNTKIDVNLVF